MLQLFLRHTSAPVPKIHRSMDCFNVNNRTKARHHYWTRVNVKESEALLGRKAGETERNIEAARKQWWEQKEKKSKKNLWTVSTAELLYLKGDGRFYWVNWRDCHPEKIWLNFVSVKSWMMSESGRSKSRIFPHPWKPLSCPQSTYV